LAPTQGVDGVGMKYQTGRAEMTEAPHHVVILEKADDGSFSAFVPDVPGCVSCGETAEEARQNIGEAIRLHIESLQSHGEPVPPPTSQACLVNGYNQDRK